MFILHPSTGILAQPLGINMEAVAKDRQDNPAKNRTIFLLVDIIPGAITNPPSYSEEFKTTTDDAGIFRFIVGNGKRVGGTVTNLLDIPWKSFNYQIRLRIAIEPLIPFPTWNYQDDWIDMGTFPFGMVPYAGASIFAQSISSSGAVITFSGGTTGLLPQKATSGEVELSGVLNIANGGTGSSVKTYVDIADTAAMLSNRFARDTSILSNRIKILESMNSIKLSDT